MKEHFQFQFENNPKVTQEKLDLVDQKTYSSGREIKIGETVLFAVINENNTNLMIALHEDELHEYEYIQHVGENIILIKRKNG